MFKFRFTFFVLAFLVLVSAINADNLKISKDPIHQKITYSPGRQIPLYQIAEDVSKLSGVTIKCGRNDYDWQTRDIPMAVSVKNIDLESFLTLLAKSAHVRFEIDESTLKNNPYERVYKLYRTDEDDKAIRLIEIKNKDIAMSNSIDKLHLDWDIVVDGAKLPKEEQDFYTLNTLVASIGEEDKAKIFMGESYVIPASDLEKGDLVIEIIKRAWSEYTKTYKVSDEVAKKNLEMFKNGKIRFKLEEKRYLSLYPYDINVQFELPDNNGKWQLLRARTISQLGYTTKTKLIKKNPELQYPTYGSIKTIEYSEIDNSLTPLANYNIDYLFPILYKPDPNIKTYSEQIQSISQQCKVNIIAEDYYSTNTNYDPQAFLIKESDKDMNAARALQYSADRMIGNKWYYSYEDNTIFSITPYFYNHQKKLILQKNDNYIKEKIAKNEFTFDDAILLVDIADKSWISEIKEIGPIVSRINFYPFKVWHFYSSLSDADKAKAKTEEGLHLSTFNLDYLSKYFDYKHAIYSGEANDMSYEGNIQAIELLESLSNKDVLASTVINIVKTPARTRAHIYYNKKGFRPDYPYVYMEPAPKSKDRFYYCLRISSIMNGEKKFIERSIGAAFPISIPDGVVVTYLKEDQK